MPFKYVLGLIPDGVVIQINGSVHSFFFFRHGFPSWGVCQGVSPSRFGMNDFSTSKTVAQADDGA